MTTTTISHLYQNNMAPYNWIIQSNEAHCNGVACYAKDFASEFGMSNWGVLLGLLHDRGKEGGDFQNYIKSTSGYCTQKNNWKDKSHSYVGAVILNSKYKDPFKIMPNIVAGHHRGLYDIDELENILSKHIPEGIDTNVPLIPIEKPRFNLTKNDIHHLTRMLYSCLVDADFLDTEHFMQKDKSENRGNSVALSQLKEKLNSYLDKLGKNAKGKVNSLRKEIQKLCLDASNDGDSFFTLTVPTGGGKTLASVLWALNYSLINDKRRIIIAIPYTSIIVQTAHVLRQIFGEENVLEHHSVVDENLISENNKLASENWDAPIIVTTNVQLFESMFSNRPGACRKLHSICNSVVILDEVQSLPLTFMQPICDTIQTYAKLFGATFLFCTASQPILDGSRKGLGNVEFNGISKNLIKDIIPENMMLHDKLRRVDIKFCNEPVSEEEIASRISSYNRVLCVVNTRKLAKEIFDFLPDDDGTNFHLSRMMCPAHIKTTIENIKNLLKDTSNRKIRVVSTQLIEAGVDIDFPIVYRQFSGLDSILQAAGRCNREGLDELGHTFVFEIDGFRSMGSVGRASDAMRSLINQNPTADWFNPDVMRAYYEILYQKTPSFDDKNILNLYKYPTNIAYEEISNQFNLISDHGVSVIVNYNDSSKLIDKLKTIGPSKSLMRKLGFYSVSISRSIFNDLSKVGIIEQPFEGIYYIGLKEQYDMRTGLKTNNEYLEQSFIV